MKTTRQLSQEWWLSKMLFERGAIMNKHNFDNRIKVLDIRNSEIESLYLKEFPLEAEAQKILSETIKTNVLENYHSRLSEVLGEVGKLSQTELDYCKELSKQEVGQHCGSNLFLEGLLARILKGEHEIIDGSLRDVVISKDHIIKLFDDLAIYEKKVEF